MANKISGTATLKPMSFRQLKRKLKKVEEFVLNRITFTLEKSTCGKETIGFRSSGSNNLGVFADDEYIIKGVIGKKQTALRDSDVYQYQVAELVQEAESYEVYHSGLVFTKCHIMDREHEKVFLESPMPLLEILTFDTCDFIENVLADERIVEDCIGEMEKVSFRNKRGLNFCFQSLPKPSIRVTKDDLNIGSVISIPLYLQLLKRGIDSLGEDIFIEFLAKGEGVFVNYVSFFPFVNETTCDCCDCIIDKELVVVVEDDRGIWLEKKLGSDLINTVDLLKVALNISHPNPQLT